MIHRKEWESNINSPFKNKINTVHTGVIFTVSDLPRSSFFSLRYSYPLTFCELPGCTLGHSGESNQCPQHFPLSTFCEARECARPHTGQPVPVQPQGEPCTQLIEVKRWARLWGVCLLIYSAHVKAESADRWEGGGATYNRVRRPKCH